MCGARNERNERTICVVCSTGEQSRTPSLAAKTWSEKRSVRLVVRDNQPRSRCLWPGLLDSFPAQSRQRKPSSLTLRRQSEVRGRRRDGCMGAVGRTARSLPAKCQTNLVLSVRSARFGSAACGATGSWPCSRLMPRSCTGRSLAVLLLRPRRQAKPHAVLRCLGRYAEHRGLWCLWVRPKVF